MQHPAVNNFALVVDDEPSLRLVLRRFLERRGWQVSEARSGEDALRMLADGEMRAPDAVIVDLNMPGLPGGVTCGRIAAEFPALAHRLVIASGDERAARDAMAVEHLDCPVLAKPFELATLEATLLGLLAAAA